MEGGYRKCSNIESRFMCMFDNGWVSVNCLLIDFCFNLLCGEYGIC